MTEEIDDEFLELIVTRYGLPTTEWKDFDAQTATLDIGRLLGTIMRLRAELKNEHARQLELKNHIRWMAQTVHGAYHSKESGAWTGECHMDICSSTRRELKEYR